MIQCQLSLRHLRVLTRSGAVSSTRRPYSAQLGSELKRRGFLADITASHTFFTGFLENPRVAYCGIDATAGSLHVGNLVPLLVLLHLHLKGHQAIALIGGATALIGDPSGRNEERPIQSAEVVQQNVAEIEKQLFNFFDSACAYAQNRSFSVANPQHPHRAVKIVNNLSWWRDFTLLDFLHSTGKSVRLSSMLSKESVRTRLGASSGISFAEFSYQLLQAHDFWHLYKFHECRIQIGGSDQWGNIVSGLDVIARREYDTFASEEDKAFGITTPLLTTSSGQKFGKTAGNAVWINKETTSVFDFYQFFLRTADTDIEKYLNIFTLLTHEEIETVMLAHLLHPELRSAQRKLADEITEMVHGAMGVSQAQAATSLLFDTELTDIRPNEAVEAFQNDPRFHTLHETELLGVPLTKLAASSGLTRSRTEAVRLIEAGGLYLNKVVVRRTDRKMQSDDLLGCRLAILRAGKDNHVVLALK
ncbi:hypothetical protein K439DRAFT_1651815 [Ramaria rubella]|nr:hypothetical protein K439DRAFT_1651815 [Ramaria rubella]